MVGGVATLNPNVLTIFYLYVSGLSKFIDIYRWFFILYIEVTSSVIKIACIYLKLPV